MEILIFVPVILFLVVALIENHDPSDEVEILDPEWLKKCEERVRRDAL